MGWRHKNKFVDEALVQAFAQSKIPPRDWFWDAVQTVAESRDDYPTWMADNADWVPWRIEAMEKRPEKNGIRSIQQQSQKQLQYFQQIIF